MAQDVKVSVQTAVNNQDLIPATISSELEQKFIKKTKASSIKLIPISILVAAIVGVIIFLLVYFLRVLWISTIGLLCIFFPIYAVYDAFATAKAAKNHDYGFYYGEVTGETENGNYMIKGLGDVVVRPLFGKTKYNTGDQTIVAMIKDDLSLISEE